MKYLVTFVFAAALLGLTSGEPFLSAFTSAVSSSTNAVRGVAVNTVKTGVNAASKVKEATVSAASNVVKSISTGAINTGVNALLEAVRSVVNAGNKKSINIPDIYQKVGPATFNATRGYFKDLSTIVKDGPANVTMNGSSIIIDIPLKLKTIDIGYEQFNATVMMMKVGGGIGIHIANDSFSTRLSLTPGFNCALKVEKVSVTVLTGIEIDFHNMGKKSDWFMNKVGNGIVTLLRGVIKSKVQEAIDSALKTAMKKEGSMICSSMLG